ncbi:MAG: hypothetical protein AB1512_28235, partial [Thermodesulfobacteriota bacterium]
VERLKEYDRRVCEIQVHDPCHLGGSSKRSFQCKINCTIKISASAGMTENGIFRLFTTASRLECGAA